MTTPKIVHLEDTTTSPTLDAIDSLLAEIASDSAAVRARIVGPQSFDHASALAALHSVRAQLLGLRFNAEHMRRP